MRLLTLSASVAFLFAAACGASTKDVETATAARYDAELGTLFDAVRELATEKYTSVDADPQPGALRTAWNQLDLATSPAEPQTDRRRGYPTHAPPVTTRYYIRFQISLVGPRPYHVVVVGQAAKLEVGDALPVELRGGDEPSWLKPRIDALVLAIHDRIKPYARN